MSAPPSTSGSYPEFIQDAPRLGNQYTEDSFIQCLLQRLVPKETLIKAEPDLKRFGSRVANELLHLSDTMERHQPQLIHYDAWGKRCDHIETCQGWKDMHGVSAEEGLIARGYAHQPARVQGVTSTVPNYGTYARLIQMTKLYMFSPSSGFYNCPLAMTDGAAKLLHSLLTNKQHMSQLPKQTHDIMYETYTRLTSTDPQKFWTSGQWMTERAGGSDVGDGCMTLARLQPDGTYALSGLKWFTSATDAHVTITLARIVQPDGTWNKGSRGISCFLMRVKHDDGTLNNIKINRLKNKLGSKQLPTAELELCGSIAHLISLPGRGIACITALINVTRIYNSIGACAGMRRIIALCRDYQHRRIAFGRTLSKHELHSETLSDMELSLRASLLLTYDLVYKMGKSEMNQSTRDEDMLLRLHIPIAKLYTAKLAVATASEGLECFGGAGYVEDTKLPRLLRDAQVLPIWEGTTNVLSFDVLRVLAGTQGECIKVLEKTISTTLASARSSHPSYTPLINIISTSLTYIITFINTAMTRKPNELLEPRARDLSYSLARVYCAYLMVQHAVWSNSSTDWDVLERFIVINELVPRTLIQGTSFSSTLARTLALDIDPKTRQPRGCGDVDVDGNVRSKL